MRSTISDLVIVLSRTDYGERDRIITILTAQHGKLQAIAKGVRAAKSKLAGGIELFAENKLVLMEGKSDLYTVISSKMERYFGGIAKDIDASMYVYESIKAVSKLTPDGGGEEYYAPLANLLEAINEAKIPLGQIKIWYGLKLLENMGVSPNFNTDTSGEQLNVDSAYQYDFDKHCFFVKDHGSYDHKHIKILRYLTKTSKPVEIKDADKGLTGEIEKLLERIITSHS